MDFLELAKKRYSVRAFKDIPVSDEKVAKIIEAGRVAPTAKNNQPQRVYVIETPEMRAKLAEVCRCTFGAPVIFAIGYNKEEMWVNPLGDGRNAGETDAAIVTASMMFEASDLELGTCWVALFNQDKVKEALGITDENIVLSALLPTGYPTEDSLPSERHNLRKHISDTVEYM